MNLLFLRHPDAQSGVWAIYEERIVKPGGYRESVPGRCGGGSPRRRSRSVRPLRSTWTGCEPVEDSLSPRGREGSRTLSDLSIASSGPTRRKTLSHLFEIVRPGLLVASETREARPRKRIRRNAPFTLTRLGGSGCRQLLAQIEVVPGLSCPSKRPDNPAMCGSQFMACSMGMRDESTEMRARQLWCVAGLSRSTRPGV